MRSDWTGETVDWAWFDVGPFGSSGHGHYDRLHLSIRSGSQSLLTDSGRFAYVSRTAASPIRLAAASTWQLAPAVALVA
jgi:hypothetical protein